MYSPAYNQLEDRAELVQFMRANSFVILVTGAGGSLHASHLPVQVNVDGEGLRLDMHMARANPQWKEFFDDEEVMVIFAGPHAYISPRWYADPARNVPTWNYLTAHVYGRIRLVDDGPALEGIVDALARKYEAAAGDAWTLAASHPGNVRSLGRVVGFELTADEVQIKAKLDQNQPAGSVAQVIDALSGAVTDDARDVAALMRETLAKRLLGP